MDNRGVTNHSLESIILLPTSKRVTTSKEDSILIFLQKRRDYDVAKEVDDHSRMVVFSHVNRSIE